MKKWHCVWPKNVKEGGEIVFPSGIRITFAGYANGNKIMEKLVKAVVLSQLELMKWSMPKKKKS
ncbi:hypothetical protein [Spiroplasma endosymbiont of Polydrusus formosus]|uniref:hypothetical protein n=1 Tax=Spiroplasma endosymbiont of Polydrusus formosus TaxID=3139326 RepID=UPI0035B50064